MKSYAELFYTWSYISQFNGWLGYLKRINRYSPQELRRIETIEENALNATRKAEEEYVNNKTTRMLAVKEFEQEFEKDFINKTKLIYITSQIRILNNIIRITWQAQARRAKTNMPTWLKEAFNELDNIKDKQRKLIKLTNNKYFLNNPEHFKKIDKITQHDVDRADAFPFEDLVEFNKLGFASCPFHAEKSPSFHFIKKSNSAYCFSCKWSGGPIKYLMETTKLTFKEAVQKLS